jgi:hypothetical protein
MKCFLVVTVVQHKEAVVFAALTFFQEHSLSALQVLQASRTLAKLAHSYKGSPKCALLILANVRLLQKFCRQ